MEDRATELKAEGIDCVFLSILPHEYKIESIIDIEQDC